MTLGVLSISRADVELDFDFAGQIILGSAKLYASLDTDSISNKFCLHCRHITVQSISINGASCNWYQRDLMTDVMMPQDGEYRDSISYTARLREAVNRSVVGELEIFLPPSGIPRGGTLEIVIAYSRPLAASYGLAQAMGSDGRSYMLFTNGGTDAARCWVPCVDALWLHHEWNISITLPPGYTAVCGCDRVESRTDEAGSCTWDFVVHKACAAGVGWAVGSFTHAHSQEALRVYTSPHLVALAPSVCVGVSRSISLARSFLYDLVHINEKADVRSRCSRGIQLLLLPEPLSGQFPWGPWLSFYGIIILGAECAHDGRSIDASPTALIACADAAAAQILWFNVIKCTHADSWLLAGLTKMIAFDAVCETLGAFHKDSATAAANDLVTLPPIISLLRPGHPPGGFFPGALRCAMFNMFQLAPHDLFLSGECYSAQWFDRAWLAVRSLETLLTRGALQRRLKTLFDYSEQKDPQIDVDEWLVTIETSETTLRGWSSVWVEGTVVPELKSNFNYLKPSASLKLAVSMEPPPISKTSALPQVRIRVYERDSTYDERIDVNGPSFEGLGISTVKVLTADKLRQFKEPPASEGAFAFGSRVFDKNCPIMWLCTDPTKSWLARVNAIQTDEMNLLQLARDHVIHNQISAIRAMEKVSQGGLQVFCDKDVAKVALVEVISSLKVHPFVCFEAAWLLPHVGIRKESPIGGGDIPDGALASLSIALKTLFAPQAPDWITRALPPPIPAPLPFSFSSALEVHAARAAVIGLYKIALLHTSHKLGYTKSLGGVAHACIMALLDACDSSACNQLDIAPVRAISLFAALAAVPSDGMNERLPDAAAIQQAWTQLMKCMRLDKLIPSQSIAATRCGILGVCQLVVRRVLPLSYKFPDGQSVSNFLLQFLDPSTPPLVSQTACFAIGRLVTVELHKSTLLLPLIAVGCLSTHSSVRQAALRALLECDPALQTLVGLPYFKECSRAHFSQIKSVQKYLADVELRQQVTELLWRCMCEDSGDDFRVRYFAARLFRSLFGDSSPVSWAPKPKPISYESLYEINIMLDTPAGVEGDVDPTPDLQMLGSAMAP